MHSNMYYCAQTISIHNQFSDFEEIIISTGNLAERRRHSTVIGRITRINK